MDKILSQEEINALFSAMSSADPGIIGPSEKSPAAPRIDRGEYHRAGAVPQDHSSRSKHVSMRHSRIQGTERHEEEPLYTFVRTISVPVGGEILNSRLTLDDLLKISKGDILELDERIGDPIYLCVGGIAMFKGRIIEREGKRAFEVSERFFE